MDRSRNGNQDKCSNCNSKDITYFDISNGRVSYVCQKCSHVGSPQKDNDIDTDSEEDACRMVESDYAALIFTDSDKDDHQSDLQITKQNINKSKPQEAAAISRFNFDDESEQSSSGVTEDDGPILQYAVNCRCQYGCQCGNQMSDLFVHHELAHSFHILECMKCFRRREFGQTKEYITFRNEKDKEKCNILSSKGEHIDDGRLVLVCRGCGNMNECTFFDVRVGDDVTHKQCGWCDESLPITTPDSLTEQAFLCSPCSYCGNQVSEFFLYTFGQDGYIERKECRKCDNTDIKLNNNASEDDIMISEYTDKEMEKMVQSLHNSEFSCPRCQNDDLYRFVITSLHDLDEIQIECDQCNFTSSIDNFSRWRHQISNNENCEHDDDDLNFEYAECSCDRGQGNYVSYKDANGKITNVVCTVCHDYTPIYHYVDGKDHSQDKVGYPSAKTSISDIHQLRPGDHIMYKRDVGYYHHEIIADVYHKTGSQRKANNFNARVIHFTGIERNDNRGSASTSFSSVSGNVKGEIREEDKFINCENEAVYRVDYDRAICFEAEKVLRRARSRIGDTHYNILFNNCEHFARWCKTGKSRSIQAEHVFKWVGENISTSSLAKGAVKSVEKSVLLAVGKSGVSRGAQQVVKEVASKGAGAVTVVAIEALNACKDWHKARKQFEAGNISKEELLSIKSRLQFKATGGVAGALAGGAVGSIVPVVGSFIGSSIGGIVGNLLGVYFHSTVSAKQK